MQPLKARAKRLDNGEWETGYPVLSAGGEAYLYDQERYSSSKPFGFVGIDPATLGYETGKLDRNGEMIFKGMRFVAEYSDGPVEFEVKWDAKECYFYVFNKELKLSHLLCIFRSADIEIVKEVVTE